MFARYEYCFNIIFAVVVVTRRGFKLNEHLQQSTVCVRCAVDVCGMGK